MTRPPALPALFSAPKGLFGSNEIDTLFNTPKSSGRKTTPLTFFGTAALSGNQCRGPSGEQARHIRAELHSESETRTRTSTVSTPSLHLPPLALNTGQAPPVAGRDSCPEAQCPASTLPLPEGHSLHRHKASNPTPSSHHRQNSDTSPVSEHIFNITSSVNASTSSTLKAIFASKNATAAKSSFVNSSPKDSFSAKEALTQSQVLY
ncbi:hypothetical protein NDU88_004741 [Pleurodeles waltl]|uniref:Uncharacterized protein n=1 Tax=Pleurodeles waltl TaxID=8319 RepID=A0AAV7QFE4_PLEWA|nr:hypothetical protein NDU88_004741 [Pleurodeles waltl]